MCAVGLTLLYTLDIENSNHFKNLEYWIVILFFRDIAKKFLNHKPVCIINDYLFSKSIIIINDFSHLDLILIN